jgi:hypothetical protein
MAGGVNVATLQLVQLRKVEGLQVYDVPPVAVNVAAPPRFTVVDGFTVIVGVGISPCIVTVAV